MSIRNLDAIFRARSVALIGASNREGSLGLVTVRNLLAGGFAGPIFPVNPKYSAVAGLAAYPDVASLPAAPDLAVICTPAHTVPELIGRLGARGTRGAIVISAGFSELGTEAGRVLQQRMLEAARPYLLRVIGPNCVGVISTPSGLNASFAPAGAKKGHIAFVAQSGAIVTSMLDWANARGIGFSHLVSVGDMSDVDFGDMLDYLAGDTATTAILLYIEAVTHPRKFLSGARAVARLKPVVAIKAGRHEAAARAATSHTGALAGMDAVYDAAFRRAGVLRVVELEELFDAVETLAAAPVFPRDDLIILTNGGGVGILAADALADLGGQLTQLPPETVAKLDAVLPPTWSKGNPVDIVGDAPPSRYAAALDLILQAPEANALLVLNAPTAIASSLKAAKAVIEVAQRRQRPILTSWLGGDNAAAARRLFAEARIPTYETPAGAARGFMHLVRYRKAQQALLEVPPSVAAEFLADEARAREIVDRALARGESWLGPDAVQDLLQSYGIPLARSATASTASEAVEIARGFGGPVAIKLVSPDILHKSDVGGVVLDVAGETAVRAAVDAIRERVTRAQPGARITGYLIQEMLHRTGAYELIAGLGVDRQFGPFLLFGQGGTATELIADTAIALPPLNLPLARALIAQTRISRLLGGYRGRPPADLEGLALTLVKLSQLICDLDEIMELDLNPLLADASGVIAADARVRVAKSVSQERGRRLPIRPYPKELESAHVIPSVGDVVLRPVKPEDASALAEFVSSLSAEDAQRRFFSPLRTLSGATLARLSQIDYDREMALLLHRPARTELLAVARLAADPDNIRAEFAVVVRSDLHRRGIGRFILARLIDYARRRGIAELIGDVLPDNGAMLGLCGALGFAALPSDTGSPVRVLLKLK